MEGVEPLLDGLLVVVDTSGRLAPVDESSGHALVTHVEVEDLGAGEDLLLELLTLGNFAGVTVDQEALGTGHLGEHGLSEEIEDHELE